MPVLNRVLIALHPVQGSDLTAFRDPNIPGALPILRVAGVGTDGLIPITNGEIWEAHNVPEPVPNSLDGTLTFEGLFNVGVGKYFKFGFAGQGITLDGTESELGNQGLSGSFTGTSVIHEKIWIMSDRDGLTASGPYIVDVPTEGTGPELHGGFKSDFDNATLQDREQFYVWRLAWGNVSPSEGEKSQG